MGVSIFFKHHLPQLYQYVPAQWHQSSAWKPAIRSAVASWICLVILLIEPAARALGNAPFFILITSFMIPPSLPFLASLEVIVRLCPFLLLAVYRNRSADTSCRLPHSVHIAHLDPHLLGLDRHRLRHCQRSARRSLARKNSTIQVSDHAHVDCAYERRGASFAVYICDALPANAMMARIYLKQHCLKGSSLTVCISMPSPASFLASSWASA